MAGNSDFLVCVSSSQIVALPLADVQEVAPAVATVKVPDSPPWVVGLMSYRGVEIPVFDVSVRLNAGTEARSPRLDDRFVIVNCGGGTCVFVLDEVFGIETKLSDEAAEISPTMSAARFATAAYRRGEAVVLVLSPALLIGEAL